MNRTLEGDGSPACAITRRRAIYPVRVPTQTHDPLPALTNLSHAARVFVLATAFAALAPIAQSARAVRAQSATEPVWPKPDVFWYRRALGNSHVWIKVDAQYGAKEPLFDHQRLAIELTIRTNVEYTPATLPFADPAMQFVVKYDGSNAYIQSGAMAIEFILGRDRWRCDLQIKWNWNLVPPTDYECLRRGPAPESPLTTAAAPQRSPDGHWIAFIQNHNVAIRPANDSSRVTALTTDGTATDAYHLGSIHWSANSRTFSAYRINSLIWQSESVTGNVKQHITRRELTVPATQR